MCIIIDNDIGGLAFRSYAKMIKDKNYSDDYTPIWKWINNKDGKLVFGGKLKKELIGNDKLKRLLIQLNSAGKAISYPDDKVDAEQKIVEKMNECVSDDPHVIALARVSKARVLCTNDDDLMEDFHNKTLIDSPRGRIYKNAKHEHLLKHHKGCPAKI